MSSRDWPQWACPAARSWRRPADFAVAVAAVRVAEFVGEAPGGPRRRRGRGSGGGAECAGCPAACFPSPELSISATVTVPMTAAATRPAATTTRALGRAGPPPSPRAGASCGSGADVGVGLGKPWESNVPAWLSTAPRRAIASGSCPAASARVRSLRAAGAPPAALRLSAAAAASASAGDWPSSRPGCSSRSRRVEQVAQRPMCRCSCSRSGTVSCPSQPSSIPLSTRQSRRPARATTTAAREASRCSRARVSSVFARVRRRQRRTRPRPPSGLAAAQAR